MPTALVPGIYDDTLADEQVEVATEDAHRMVLRLAREEGLLVGVSSRRESGRRHEGGGGVEGRRRRYHLLRLGGEISVRELLAGNQQRSGELAVGGDPPYLASVLAGRRTLVFFDDSTMNTLHFTPAQLRQIEREGCAAYPNECCGVLIGRDEIIGRDGRTAGGVRRVVERLTAAAELLRGGRAVPPLRARPAGPNAGREGRGGRKGSWCWVFTTATRPPGPAERI